MRVRFQAYPLDNVIDLLCCSKSILPRDYLIIKTFRAISNRSRTSLSRISLNMPIAMLYIHQIASDSIVQDWINAKIAEVVPVNSVQVDSLPENH